MPRYLDMLRAANVFKGPRPLGMPDIDDGSVESMFRSVVPLASSLKDDDMRRRQQMMEFEASLARRNQPQTQPTTPMKKNVVYGGIHPPTALQQQFRQDAIVDTAQKNRMATLGATQTGALNNSTILNKQRSDADMAKATAEINGRETVARMNREMAAKAADDARTDKAKTDEIARTQKGPIINTPDPKDPTKMIATRHNPVTNKLERVQVDEDQAGTAYKPGNIPKPTVNPGQDPAKLAAVRASAKSAMDELNELLDKDGNLREHAADAVGPSRLPGKWLDTIGLGSLTPSTTKGAAGIKSLSAKLVLETIGEMKAQSKTGATGFGALNLKELGVLEAAASKLNATDMSDDDYKEELKRIRERLNMIMQDSTGSGGGGGDRTDELIRKYGG